VQHCFLIVPLPLCSNAVFLQYKNVVMNRMMKVGTSTCFALVLLLRKCNDQNRLGKLAL